MRNLNSLTEPKKGGKSHSVKKSGKGTLLLWNGFLSHARGFGCVENEVLSTYGFQNIFQNVYWEKRLECLAHTRYELTEKVLLQFF